MRTLALALVAAPLLVTGCKKQQEPEALPAAPIAAQAGPGTFKGPGASGTIAFPMQITNQTAGGLEVAAVALRVPGADGPVCKSRTDVGARMRPGESLPVPVSIEGCAWDAIGAPDVRVVADVVTDREGVRASHTVQLNVNVTR